MVTPYPPRKITVAHKSEISDELKTAGHLRIPTLNKVVNIFFFKNDDINDNFG